MKGAACQAAILLLFSSQHLCWGFHGGPRRRVLPLANAERRRRRSLLRMQKKDPFYTVDDTYYDLNYPAALTLYSDDGWRLSAPER
jgi:hypothetical protein